MKHFIVICRDDEGDYTSATEQLFDYEEARKYAAHIPVSRQAKIVTPREFLVDVLGWRE